MTDRELLELAAKAAGLELVFNSHFECFLLAGGDAGWDQLWIPLDDDGAALRLACDLGLSVYPIARTLSGASCSAVATTTGERLSEVSDVSLDVRTATRRAIVLAAAEIGKGMNNG